MSVCLRMNSLIYSAPHEHHALLSLTKMKYVGTNSASGQTNGPGISSSSQLAVGCCFPGPRGWPRLIEPRSKMALTMASCHFGSSTSKEIFDPPWSRPIPCLCVFASQECLLPSDATVWKSVWWTSWMTIPFLMPLGSGCLSHKSL